MSAPFFYFKFKEIFLSDEDKKKPEIHPNDNKLFNKIVEVFDGEILR